MSAGRTPGKERLYLELPTEMAKRIGQEAEARDLPMTKLLERLVKEAFEALRPVQEWRLTTLPTYDPTELEKTKVAAGPSKPCDKLVQRIRDFVPNAAYCPDCGWHVEMHLHA